MEAKIFKLSPSGKTALIGHKANARQIGYTFAWASALEGDKVGDVVEDFNPTGTVQAVSEAGEAITHQDGSPVLRWVF